MTPFRPQKSNFSGSRALGRHKKGLIGVLGVAAVIAVILLAARFAPHFLATPAQVLARPLIAIRDAAGAGIDDALAFFQSKASLQKENENLQEEIIFYKAITAERDYYLAQSETLQELLGQTASSSPQFVAGRILEKPSFSPYDTMLVAAGSNDGVATGDLVFADPHTLIGYVSSVSAEASTIVAYSTPGQQINVLIGSSSIEAAATGLGGGTLEVRLPRNSPVSTGDIVMAAGLTGQDILGRLTVAAGAPTDPYERALFTSPLDIFDLSYVLIQTPVSPSHAASHEPVKK